jgi:(p)ppGpp synthase/HD superfamily hydrolase
MGNDRVELALFLATVLHYGQTDKSGAPYILHPIRVMLAGETTAERIVGVLHDVVEDCNYTVENIRNSFGQEVSDAVEAISHRENEPRVEYLARILENNLARVVKLNDLEDNMLPERMAQIDPKTVLRLQAKYHEAMEVLSLRRDD